MPTVLVVDDEPQIATIARDYLSRAGFSVEVVTDGTSGLEMARRVRPDLVVLDLGLPRLDGLAVARYTPGGGRVLVGVGSRAGGKDSVTILIFSSPQVCRQWIFEEICAKSCRAAKFSAVPAFGPSIRRPPVCETFTSSAHQQLTRCLAH
jgi:hypothetical protein